MGGGRKGRKGGAGSGVGRNRVDIQRVRRLYTQLLNKDSKSPKNIKRYLAPSLKKTEMPTLTVYPINTQSPQMEKIIQEKSKFKFKQYI